MSKDVKMFNICNHIVDGEYYEGDSCPKCYGKGHYYDICFDNDGKTVIASGNIKLQQEVLKILNDKKGGSKYYSEWGNSILANDGIIGSKNINSSQKIQMAVFESLQHLKNVQINNQLIFSNMTESEIIDNIISVNVNAVPPTGYIVTVKFSNSVGDIFEQVIQV